MHSIANPARPVPQVFGCVRRTVFPDAVSPSAGSGCPVSGAFSTSKAVSPPASPALASYDCHDNPGAPRSNQETLPGDAAGPTAAGAASSPVPCVSRHGRPVPNSLPSVAQTCGTGNLRPRLRYSAAATAGDPAQFAGRLRGMSGFANFCRTKSWSHQPAKLAAKRPLTLNEPRCCSQHQQPKPAAKRLLIFLITYVLQLPFKANHRLRRLTQITNYTNENVS